ncbi:urea transporter [Rhodococcus sp. D2-41]|nr:urea transporter [Rhodococcus sp. D2-41]
MQSAWCGLFFAAALFASGWKYGLFALIGTAVSTLTALVWQVDGDRVLAGLEGFNGALVGTAAGVFLGPEYLSSWLMAAAGSVAATIVTAALVRLLGTWDIPTLTFPFCITAAVLTIAAPEFQRLWHGRTGLAGLVEPAQGPTGLGWADLWRAFFANVAQIFFMPQWYVGLLFLAGIFVASRRAGVVASLGSVVGIVTAWALGSPADEIRAGLLGYNAVLVALALCGVFLAVSVWSVAYAVIGAASSTGVTGALSDFFTPVGGHTLTWPFCLTTLVFLLAAPALPRLRRTG